MSENLNINPRWSRRAAISLVLLVGLIERIFNVIRFPVLPSAFDPWIHLSVTRAIIENGNIFIDIYRGGFAFHTLMAFLQMVTGIPLFEVVKYAPIVLGVFSLLPLYVLFKEITKSESIAVVSTLIMSCMAFDFIYATNQFWPELTTLSLIALVILFFVRSIRNPSPRNTLIGALLFLVVVMSHDLSGMVLASILVAMQLLSLLLFRKYTLHSLVMVGCGISFLGFWLVTFAPTYVLGILNQFSSTYHYLAASIAAFLVLLLVLRRLRKQDDLREISTSKSDYVLGMVSAIILVVTILFVFQQPFGSFINETISYYALAVPMWSIIVLLTTIGAVILLRNLHWQSLLILSLAGGVCDLILATFFLFLHGYHLIEIERILAFAFIGLSMICSVGFIATIKKNNGYGRKVLLSSMLVFLIIPASIWSFPSPGGGLPYINWNTESEYWFASWSTQHMPQDMIISDWRIGYILRGFLEDYSGNKAIVTNAMLLYPENYTVIQSKSLLYDHIIIIVDDWMIDNGPTQPLSYGPTHPLNQAIIYYNLNTTYIKVYDNTKEWAYYVMKTSEQS